MWVHDRAVFKKRFVFQSNAFLRGIFNIYSFVSHCLSYRLNFSKSCKKYGWRTHARPGTHIPPTRSSSLFQSRVSRLESTKFIRLSRLALGEATEQSTQVDSSRHYSNPCLPIIGSKLKARILNNSLVLILGDSNNPSTADFFSGFLSPFFQLFAVPLSSHGGKVSNQVRTFLA